MRIAVNTRFLLPGKLEGIGWFTFESLKRIVENHPEHQFIFFFDRNFDPQFLFAKNIIPVVLKPQARHPLLWYLWFEWQIPAAIKKYGADVFLSTDGYLSLRLKNIPQILVMHDLAFEHFHHHVNKLVNKYYRFFSPRFANKAARIATVSQFTKNDIVNKYHVVPEKIDVVYNGSNEMFCVIDDKTKTEVQKKFTGGKPFFIYAGAIQPRKNISNLFRAFDRFKSENNCNVQLVIAGRKAWHTEDAMKVYEIMKFKNDVIFTGHLERIDLSRLMGSALALTYVSLFEGFGIPIIEAMNAGVPVITSNVSSMPEIAGSAALLVDPQNEIEISNAMKNFYGNDELRKKYVELGFINCKRFGWDITAAKLWKTVSTVIETIQKPS